MTKEQFESLEVGDTVMDTESESEFMVIAKQPTTGVMLAGYNFWLSQPNTSGLEPLPLPSNGIWWCRTHNREATHIAEKGDRKGRHECDPSLGGITMGCHAIWVIKLESK